MNFRLFRLFVLTALLVVSLLPVNGGTPIVKAESNGPIFLPGIINQTTYSSGPMTGDIVVNAPYIPVSDVVDDRIAQMGIFWFGSLDSSANYSDVRIGYNDTALWVHIATIDKYLFYNTSSTGSDLENWDSSTLLIDLDGSTKNGKPGQQSYRFVAQLRHWESEDNYQTAYRGNSNQWVQQGITFGSRSGWRGNGFNDAAIDNGWMMTYIVPFSSLGLSGKPADGTIWKISMLTHDRDRNGNPVDQRWPDLQQRDVPSSWANVRFGLPIFETPAVNNVQTTMIRQGLNGMTVVDSAAGGGFICGADNEDIWSQWGDRNFGGREDFNIQNQEDISDWPCFSKFYVTFPLNLIPSGKVIRSATLVMHLYGGSDPSAAYDSHVQVLRVGEDWDEYTLTWNNAPYALENSTRTRVHVYTKSPIVWPGDPYEWDVSRLVTQAYEEQVPLRLALYSGDSPMHSGKYFVSSDVGDWNAEGRPTLIVEWGDP